jgi:lysophospholipase L1-like esterase
MKSLSSMILALVVLSQSGAQTSIDPVKAKLDEKGILWYEIQHLDLEGKGWADTKAPFDRFPEKAEGKVPASVWGLSRHSAGMAVRFVTDAPSLQLRWSVTNAKLEMPHMPATGVSGLDLYVRSAKDGRWQWLTCGFPKQQKNNLHTIALPPGKHEYLLYLPLYNGTASVEIGLPKTALLEKGPARPEENRKPVLFYGTSITQGGCASRPGMVHTAIIGRKFERPTINLGFSGSGKMDSAVVDLLAELDPSVYVIDCLPNMDAKMIEERTAPLVQTLRKAHPKTPILLVEDRTYANAAAYGANQRNSTNRAALAREYEKLLAAKVEGLHYLKGDNLIGHDGEGTVDGSHPTDLGFARQAEVMAEAIAPLLPQKKIMLQPIEGYTDKLSYAPGEEVRVHVSSELKFFKYGIYRVGAKRELFLEQLDIAGKLHPVPTDASSLGCQWPMTFSFKIRPDWPSGYYTIRFGRTIGITKEEPLNVANDVFFVVRSANPGKNAKILLQLSTNTYNAYCNWGGYSLYAYNGLYKIQGRRVSFERPIAGQFKTWELPFVEWAEKNGYAIDYAVNSDLEFHPEILKHYKLVLSVGHDEYWSAPMRDNLEKYIADGGNVAFFSGNTCCWQVRSEENGRALTCWKQSFENDPIFATGNRKLLSSLWGHYLINRPENQLTGVGFLWGGYRKSHGQFMTERAEFTAHRPEHWMFEGTKLKAGDKFGGGDKEGKNKVVGYECDGCELEWKDGLPSPTCRDGTPKNFAVLASCPARWHPDDCEWYERWEKGRTGQAVVGSYTRGGTVVTVGTTDWAHGLRGGDPVVIQMTKNVLERLAK